MTTVRAESGEPVRSSASFPAHGELEEAIFFGFPSFDHEQPTPPLDFQAARPERLQPAHQLHPIPERNHHTFVP